MILLIWVICQLSLCYHDQIIMEINDNILAALLAT